MRNWPGCAGRTRPGCRCSGSASARRCWPPRSAARWSPRAAPEIGWVTVDTADPELIPPGPWLEFHHDRCLPPAHATVLARNDLGVQAYRLGRHLAVQFHPEVDGDQFRLWLDAGGRAEIEAAGLDPDLLLAQTIAEEPEAAARADRLVASALRIAAQARAG